MNSRNSKPRFIISTNTVTIEYSVVTFSVVAQKITTSMYSTPSDTHSYLKLNETKIRITKSEPFLGVIMDSKLNWKTHIAKLACKLSHNAGILYKLKGQVPNRVLELVYNNHVQSHLNYCSDVWGLGSKIPLIIFLLHRKKKAIRSIKNGYVKYFYNKETGEIPCHKKIHRKGLLSKI